MKISKLTGLSLFVAGSLFMASCGGGDKTATDKPLIDSTATTQTPTTTTVSGNFNYALGMMIGTNLSKGLGIDLKNAKTDEFCDAIKAALDGSKPTKEVKEAGMSFNQEAQKVAMAKQGGTAVPAFSPKFMYNAGLNFGYSFKAGGVDAAVFNVEDFKRGFKAALGEGTPEMDMPTAELILKQESEKLNAAAATKNIEAGKKFLEENLKKNPKLKTTASGIQYEILKEGNGPKPTAADKVTTHYHGTLIDGTVFDSSVDRKTPADFPVNGVIKGWQEILQLMPKGSKWRVYIPSDLAYGPQGNQGIAPNSTLIFEMELLKINGK
jgi:FKBP-type peptidyl-prolyl cis-trans isomerase FklB